MENNYLIMIAVFALFVFLIYKEVRRANRARLLLRLMAVFLAIAGLTFLFFPLKYTAFKNKEGGKLNLVTDGADFNTLKGQVYYTTDSSVLLNSGPNSLKYIPDLAYYLQQHPDINTVSLYGNGLEPAELKLIKNYNYEFHPAVLPGGILSCSWPGILKQAELLNVQGVYNNTNEQAVKLILEGLGSGLDSVVIPAHAAKPYFLKAPPRQIGKALYTLTVLKGSDTLQQEKIPFQVIESPKIKLLVLSSFPDFEYKFLKNWLFENNYQVVFRTRISKDKFSIDQLNTTALNAETINATVLSKFDGVIADDEELAKSDPMVTASLRSAITQGLGLLIRMHDLKALSQPAQYFKLYTNADSTAKFFTPILTGEINKLKKLPVNHDLYIQPQAAEQQLVKDQDGKVLLSTRLAGNGKITGAVITSTYHWILAGNTADYATYWSAVIGATVRKTEKSTSWRTLPALPVKGKQTQLIYQSAEIAAPQIGLDGAQLNPLQNTIIPYSWESKFWPQHSGWNELKISSNPTEYLFVYDKTDWKTIKQYQILMENTAFAKKYISKSENNSIKSDEVEKEVSKWWFFALFLISIGYMWFETKLL